MESSPQGGTFPVVCSLSDVEMRTREAEVLSEIRSRVTAFEELPHGYAFHIPGDSKSLALAGELIALERECCQFLSFQLTAESGLGHVVLALTGPEGTKQFLRTTFLNEI